MLNLEHELKELRHSVLSYFDKVQIYHKLEEI